MAAATTATPARSADCMADPTGKNTWASTSGVSDDACDTIATPFGSVVVTAAGNGPPVAADAALRSTAGAAPMSDTASAASAQTRKRFVTSHTSGRDVDHSR